MVGWAPKRYRRRRSETNPIVHSVPTMLIVLLAGGFGSEAQAVRKGAAFVDRWLEHAAAARKLAGSSTTTHGEHEEADTSRRGADDVVEPGAHHREISADMQRRLAHLASTVHLWSCLSVALLSPEYLPSKHELALLPRSTTVD